MTWDSSLVDTVTWIGKKDYERAKEKAFGFSSTVAAIKADVTLIKAEISGLALFSAGASVTKFDYSLLKVDEKGVTWRGRQIYATKQADEVKHFQTKLDRSQLKFQEEVEKLKAAQSSWQESKKELEAANKRVDRVQGQANYPPQERSRLRQEQRQARDEYQRMLGQYESLKTRVTTLQGRISSLQTKMNDAKPDSKFKEAEAELAKLQQALQAAARAA